MDDYALVSKKLTAPVLAKRINRSMGHVYALTVAPLKFAGMFDEDHLPKFDASRMERALQTFHHFGVVELGVQRYANQICFDGEIPQPHWMVRAIIPLHEGCNVPREISRRCNKFFKGGALPDGKSIQCSASLMCPESAAIWLHSFLSESVAEYRAETSFVRAMVGQQPASPIDLSQPVPHRRKPLSKTYAADVRMILNNNTGDRIISAGCGSDVADLVESYLI